MLLAILGVLGGLIVADFGVSLLQRNLVEKMTVPGWFDFRVDSRVIAVAVVAMVASALLAGIVPAWKASRVDVAVAPLAQHVGVEQDGRPAKPLGDVVLASGTG